jgi:hypothetical protein
VQAVLGWTFLVIVFLVISSTAQAQDNQCDPGEYPDVIVGDLHQTVDYGSVGDISAFSVGTVSCNIGTCWLNWFASGTEHPVIAQNMFRLKDGRFTQIGQSWLKHGFTALQQDVCATPENPCQPSGTGSRLGVYCSDPYGAGLNGIQTGLGPKFEVNAATGEYIWPPTDLSQTGNAIYKRLQVHNDDLDPNLNPGAQYFVEGQYVTHDDATAGRMNNNSSYRAINVSGSSGNFSIALTDATVREQAALFAWVAAQPGVKVSAIHVPEDPPGCDFALGRCGQINVGYVATANPDGTWRYEFAVQNQTSECSVGTFHVPIEAIAYVTNVGFRDVDYHSGEPFDDTDWVWDRDASGITWHTVGDYAADPNGNAIRWGTLYNFWFDTTIRPGAGGFMQLGTFNPCTTPDVDVFARFPGTCAEGSDGRVRGVSRARRPTCWSERTAPKRPSSGRPRRNWAARSRPRSTSCCARRTLSTSPTRTACRIRPRTSRILLLGVGSPTWSGRGAPARSAERARWAPTRRAWRERAAAARSRRATRNRPFRPPPPPGAVFF